MNDALEGVGLKPGKRIERQRATLWPKRQCN